MHNESWQKRRDNLLLNLTLEAFQTGTGRFLHNQGVSETRATISALASLFTSFAICNAFGQDSVVGIKWLSQLLLPRRRFDN